MADVLIQLAALALGFLVGVQVLASLLYGFPRALYLALRGKVSQACD